MANSSTMFKRILVPVDGSMFSLHAVSLAKRLALHHGSTLLLLHVLDSAVVTQLQRFSQKSHEQVRSEMEKSARGVLKGMLLDVGEEKVPVDFALREGVPHEVILQEADSWQADLIIMGKLGKRGIDRILLGSVAERVIEFAKLPVMLATA